MIIDILCGLALLYFMYRGSQSGAMSSLYRAGIAGGALLIAKLLAKPTANYITKGIEWSAPFADGLCFFVYFLVILVALHFAMGSLVSAAENHAGDGGTMDKGVGALVALGRGAIIVYAILASMVLMTHRLGAKKPMFAVAYHQSYLGRFVMTRNIVDREPFPNAYVLRVLVGAEENGGHNPSAIGLIQQLAGAQFLATEQPVIDAIHNKDWKSLRTNAPLLELMCSADFLRFADDYYTPQHKVEAEDPSKRFEELKAK